MGADRDSRVSSRYLGAEGERYFSWQAGAGALAGRLTAPLYAPFVGRDAVVLDFGCGGGALLAALPAGRRIGVEPNPSARAQAASRGLETCERVDDVPDASVDVVVSNHALEHALQPFAELEQLRRVLRPGGRLLLVVPLDDWRTQRDVHGSDPNQHVYAWTPLALANLVRAAGFTVERCDVISRAWPPGVDRLSRLPGPLFAVLAWATAVLRRRRQLRLVASV